jgi:hypothetical protein
MRVYAHMENVTDWEDDLLGTEVLEPGHSFKADLDLGPGRCEYEIMVHLADEQRLHYLRFDACKETALHLEMDALMATGATAEVPTDYEARLAGYATFLESLQRAVRAEDRTAILSLVRTPLRVNHSDGSATTSYDDPQSVAANFDAIFDEATIKAILQQSPQSIFSRDIGAMVGSGEVWFDNVCLNGNCTELGPVKIYAINHM